MPFQGSGGQTIFRIGKTQAPLQAMVQTPQQGLLGTRGQRLVGRTRRGELTEPIEQALDAVDAMLALDLLDLRTVGVVRHRLGMTGQHLLKTLPPCGFHRIVGGLAEKRLQLVEKPSVLGSQLLDGDAQRLRDLA